MDERILIAEDEKQMNQMICDYLSALGYETMSAYDGIEAVNQWKNSTPDLIILDIMMPRMDGFDVLRRIRGGKTDTPVIMLTAKADESDKIMGLDIGADDYVVKPFSMKELAARIRAVLRRMDKQTPQDEKDSSRLVYEELALDPETYEVTKADKPIKLTSVQFEILKLFMKYPRRVFSRLDLLNAFQDTDMVVYERTIDVHIKNLRKVLETTPSNPDYIQTIWGVGYKLEKAHEKD